MESCLGRGEGGGLLLSGISHSRNGSALASFTYDYDPSGRITTWGRNLGGVASTWAFEYSRASELAGATLKNATGQVAKSMRYLYDGSGNRVLNGVDSTAQYARYNNLNQLGKIGGAGPALIEGTVDEPSTVTVNGIRTETVQVPGTQTWRFERQIEATEGTNTVSIVAKDAQNNTRSDQWQFSVGPVEKTLLYDDNGNLKADGARTLNWDTRDRLTSVTIDGVSYSWEYDGMDRRIRELRNGVLVKQWIWDGLEIIQERDGAGAITKTFYQQGVIQGGASYFYTRDHLGSIREMIDASGVVRARYDYDLWGQREKLAGDLDADLGYTGHFTHQGAKMVMAPFRQYDAALGRWLSRDPIGEAGGLNLYGYVHSDPINCVDPNGQFAFIPFLVGMGIGMAIDWAYDKYVDPHVQAFLDDTFGCETANTLRKLKRAIDFARSLKNPIKALKNLRANAGSLKGLRGVAAKKTAWTSKERRNAWKEKGRASGEAPKREVIVVNKKTGEIETRVESKELHHSDPRRNGGSNDGSNLKEVWPTEHAAIDPHRHTGYDVITEIPAHAFTGK